MSLHRYRTVHFVFVSHPFHNCMFVECKMKSSPTNIEHTSIEARRWASQTKSRRASDIASAASAGTRLLVTFPSLMVVTSCLETEGGILGDDGRLLVIFVQ